MRCWAIQFVLCLLLFSSEGLELEIVENGETKPMPSVVQTKAGTTFSLVCNSESCRDSCESLTWRRRRKGTGPSLETSPASNSNWLNFSSTTLDDQGFYDCVDIEHKTGKVMYLVVRKPGFEKESIDIIKKDLVLIRKKRDRLPFGHDFSYEDSWQRDLDEQLQEIYATIDRINKDPLGLGEIDTGNKYDSNPLPYYPSWSSNDAPKTNVNRGVPDHTWSSNNAPKTSVDRGNADKEYIGSSNYNDHNTNYQNNHDTNLFKTDDQPKKVPTSKTLIIIWVIGGCVIGVIIVSTMIYTIVRFYRGGFTNRENVSRPTPTFTYNCYHTACQQYRAQYPTMHCLYSTPGSTFATTTVNETILPSSPLLEAPTAPPMTDLNEVGQNGKGQGAMPPSYEDAVYNTALGPPDPPSDVCHNGSGGRGSSHDT